MADEGDDESSHKRADILECNGDLLADRRLEEVTVGLNTRRNLARTSVVEPGNLPLATVAYSSAHLLAHDCREVLLTKALALHLASVVPG